MDLTTKGGENLSDPIPIVSIIDDVIMLIVILDVLGEVENRADMVK
jgi:hypothetical protein